MRRKLVGNVAMSKTPLDRSAGSKPTPDAETEPDWEGECEVCGASPIVPATGMCGPCTFGEADTADGNW
jgi:hypothetical protein